MRERRTLKIVIAQAVKKFCFYGGGGDEPVWERKTNKREKELMVIEPPVSIHR